MKAFVLAGGFATRLWPLTEHRAKPLLPLAGKPLLTHLAEKIPGVISITISTNAVFADDFEKWKATNEQQSSVHILIEDAGHEDEKLGALGAVAKWITEHDVDDDILLLAGDNYMGFSISSFLERFSGIPLIATCDIRDRDAAKKFGIVVAESAPVSTSGAYRVTGFQEKPEHPQSTLVSTGCTVLPANTLPMLVEYARAHPDNIGGIFEHFLQAGIRVECVPFAEPWFDIGSFEAYIQATEALVGQHMLTGADVSVQDTTADGSTVIGDRSIVQGSTLRNVVLFEDCVIEDCVLQECIIDTGCALRGVDVTGKMVRAGTVLHAP